MDVSRPGKGKIVATSRPVVAPVVSAAVEGGDIATIPEVAGTAAEQPAVATSVPRKVIQPLEPAEAEESAAQAEVDTTDGTADAPEPADNLPTPKADPENPITPEEPEADMSGAASVDEMAKAAEQKRLDAEAAKAAAEQEKKLQELTASRKYFVPIKGAGTAGSRKRPFAILIIAVLLLLGGYLLIDAGVVGKDISLPYEFIKDTEEVDMQSRGGAIPLNEPVSADAQEQESVPSGKMYEGNGISFIYPDSWTVSEKAYEFTEGVAQIDILSKAFTMEMPVGGTPTPVEMQLRTRIFAFESTHGFHLGADNLQRCVTEPFALNETMSDLRFAYIHTGSRTGVHSMVLSTSDCQVRSAMTSINDTVRFDDGESAYIVVTDYNLTEASFEQLGLGPESRVLQDVWGTGFESLEKFKGTVPYEANITLIKSLKSA